MADTTETTDGTGSAEVAPASESTPTPTTAADTAGARRPFEVFYILILGLVGLGFGLRRISDNSAILHIRTGFDMAHGSGIPRVDPYSFTAHGHRWVVQSWLAELAYGWSLRLGGAHLLLVFNGVLVLVLTLLMAFLARNGSGVRTLIAASIAFGLLVEGLSPRPLVVGLVCLALTVTILERDWAPWWHVPVVWVWVNSHGSFPLGAAWLFFVAVGAAVDLRALPRRELRHFGAFLAGLVVACVNPLGPRLLAFPLAVRDKQAIFKSIIEWKSPDFQSKAGLVMLVFLTLAIAVVVRGRLGWVDALPVAFFVGFGLYAVRNLAPAAVILAPVLGRALRPRPVDGVDRPVPRLRVGPRPFDRALAAFLVVVGLLMVAYAYTFDAYDLQDYPVALVTKAKADGWLDPSHRMAEQDIIGDYLASRFGNSARVFIDDRYDMYPLSVSQDYQALLRADPAVPDILARYGIDLVLWDRRQGLVSLLQSDGWQSVESDASWILLRRP